MTANFLGMCFGETGGVPFRHDPGLIVLSYFIAVVGSYAALEMIDRWRHAAPGHDRKWQISSAFTLGGSIWSMHFIAMLALEIGFPVTYAPGETMASLLIAVGVVGLGLQIIRGGHSWIRVAGAGVLVGLGVAAMHYVGMAGLRFPGALIYRPTLWTLSLLIAVASASVALWLSLTLRKRWQRAVAAFVMGGAIAGMHYTGMAASIFEFDPLAVIAPGVPGGPIAAAVASTTVALILCALTFVAADRRLLAAATREAEALRRSMAEMALANGDLERGRKQFDAVLSNITQGICLFDGNRRLLSWNRRYVEIYNLPAEHVREGLTLEDIVELRYQAGTMPEVSHFDQVDGDVAGHPPADPASTVLTLASGRVIAVHRQPMADGGWVSTQEDITERQLSEAKISYMARHDALTRLGNRTLFHERLEQAMAAAGRGQPFAVMCLDLDNFKIVNDTLGHPAGDELLQAVAERLQACAREGDTVARLGGDEFAIIQLSIDRPENAHVLANRILRVFSDPFDISGQKILIGTSIGVTMAPDDGSHAEALLKNADIALYLAKTEGRGTVRFFEPEMDARIKVRRSLEFDLGHAVSRNEFELHYQPLVNLQANRINGFEALLRWRHPLRGLVSPLDFIPLAEETGLIVAIGEWVLRAACLEATKWPEEITVAVNLSPVQFKTNGLVATVKAALEQSGLKPTRLELEITESVLLKDTEATLTALHQLRAMGIAIALDDFGTGYSSLSYLRSFPFDKIKIDQSFVRDSILNRDSMSIIRAVTGLGQSLRVKTTAEGVETVEQLEMLRNEGCTEVQGYFFSKPQPASELPGMIARLHEMENGIMQGLVGYGTVKGAVRSGAGFAEVGRLSQAGR